MVWDLTGCPRSALLNWSSGHPLSLEIELAAHNQYISRACSYSNSKGPGGMQWEIQKLLCGSLGCVSCWSTHVTYSSVMDSPSKESPVRSQRPRRKYTVPPLLSCSICFYGQMWKATEKKMLFVVLLCNCPQHLWHPVTTNRCGSFSFFSAAMDQFCSRYWLVWLSLQCWCCLSGVRVTFHRLRAQSHLQDQFQVTGCHQYLWPINSGDKLVWLIC